jgi:hypothetical protein
MIRPLCAAAVLAAFLALPAIAAAEPQTDVADAFMAAAKTQDRKATLNLLAADVSIEFPAGRGEGQPFVIGYLDGLFDADRGLSLDSAGAEGDSVRFLAHEDRSQERYAIEVEVRNHQVVKVTVNPQHRPSLAELAPAS